MVRLYISIKAYTKKTHINIKLKLTTNIYYHEKETAYWDIVTSVLLKTILTGSH